MLVVCGQGEGRLRSAFFLLPLSLKTLSLRLKILPLKLGKAKGLGEKGKVTNNRLRGEHLHLPCDKMTGLHLVGGDR